MPNAQPSSVPSGAAMDRVVPRARWPRRAGLAGLAVAVAVAIALVVAGTGSAGRTFEVAGHSVTTAEVVQGQFDDFVQARGRFIPLRTIYIDTVQGGQVEAMHVENGAAIEAGQPLVDLSNTALQLEVISREAQITEQLNNLRSLELAHEQNDLTQKRELVEVEYQITRLERELRRSAELVDRGALPRGDVEELRDELDYFKKRRVILRDSQRTATRLEKAQLVQLRRAAEQLEENLKVARKNLDGLHVKAQAAGQLTAFDLQVGQSLAPGERIGQIDDPTSFKIRAEIDEFYLGRVDIGQRALYRAGDTDYPMHVQKIRPQVKNSRFEVDLVFEGAAPDRVRRGQTAQLKVQLGQPSPAVLVPNAAFYSDTGGAWVFVVSSDGSQAVRRNVRLGRRNPKNIEVLEGLAPGEVLITSPYTSFLDTERLVLSDPEASHE